MIGPYGIVVNEDVLNKNDMINALDKMSDNIDIEDFFNKSCIGQSYSIGMTFRTIGDNKDLAMRQIDPDFLIAFSGYGKLKGEKRLYWAEEMIDKLVPLLRQNNEDGLKRLEGSFLCIAYHDKKLLIISDRLGSKNMYYYDNNNGLFIFAPDVGSVLDSDLFVRKKNIESAKQVLLTGFFVDDETLDKNVFFFPAGSILKKNTNKCCKTEINRYWDMPSTEGAIGTIDSSLIEDFNNKLSQSVYELAELEKHSVIPLSGGLDSRTIACFLAKKQRIKTITYDMGDEVNVAKKVCKVLGGTAIYFNNKMLESDYFKKALFKATQDQKIHSVVNQYFYAPLFRQYFNEQKESAAIYDGIYMDILFSGAPCIYEHFDFDRFLKTYGGNSIDLAVQMFSPLNKADLLKMMEEKYKKLNKILNGCDGIGKSQQFYATGRLRRYCGQALSSRENYCYVFKPGFNYDLMDFGYSLNFKLRRGLLYTLLLNKEFPEVMRIRYKDSYGNRAKTLNEKIIDEYKRFRLKLSSATFGMINYSPFQADYYFLKQKGIDDYRDQLLKKNCLGDIITDSQLLSLFNNTKKKYYYFNLFQRVLFLQQFYAKYNF